jgi:hypothetical protein
MKDTIADLESSNQVMLAKMQEPLAQAPNDAVKTLEDVVESKSAEITSLQTSLVSKTEEITILEGQIDEVGKGALVLTG